MTARWALAGAFSVGMVLGSGCSCGGDGSGGKHQGDPNPGDPSAGDADLGDTTPGDTANGDMDVGDTSAGDVDVCYPNCVGRACGDDGCGGSCGTCDDLAAPYCDALTGTCLATCTPVCAGRNCGSDGCGGTCGTCVDGLACSQAGVCAPTAWTCQPTRYAARDQCDCACGAYDPDCDLDALAIANCAEVERCASDGACAPVAPAGWMCPAAWYGGRDACDCACGVADPDCDNSALPVRGCNGRLSTCNSAAACACTPNCGDNVCGDDGCGGSCGNCSNPDASICSGGACVSACNPTPIRCKFAECGPDACGGTCGACGPGTNCIDGTCFAISVSDPLTCFGQCGNYNPVAGCSCASDCATQNSCCPDYANTCGTCLPECGDRVCGPDGCGGTCGLCGDGESCSAGVCIAGCQTNCDGRACGDDGCGGQCGSCSLGESCQWTGVCVPDEWFCDTSVYGDGNACRCGCGAPDPSCELSSIVFGCGAYDSTCSGAGICSDTTCASDAACGTGKVCYGTYYQGNARFRGVCAGSLGGASVGSLCGLGEACATGVCADGLCRRYCANDADCGGQEICTAMPQRDTRGDIKGFVNVCELLPGRFGTCVSQTECPQQACVAVLNPDLSLRYTCSNTSRALGASCDSTPCDRGQLCVGTARSDICTLPCPGGDGDCPNGWSCGQERLDSVSFDPGATVPTIPVCLPN